MFEKVKEIYSPRHVLEMLPLKAPLAAIKAARDHEISEIIARRDKRLVVIIGPCSADNEDAVCDYVARLRLVADKVRDKLMIIPRIYTNKPRTKGEGYKGILHNPDPEKETDILEGIFSLRKMHIRAIAESGLSAADEMLYPENYAYVEDLLTYVAIGARSSENQQHRLVCSGVEVPVGVKNPMNGSLRVMLNSIHAVQIPNEFKYFTHQVKTTGNPYAHAVLRGSVDLNGVNAPNYHYEDIIKLNALYDAAKLQNPAIIIDTNHSNSDKKAEQQVRIVHEVMTNYRHDSDFARYFRGFLIESYIEGGRQDIGKHTYGKSYTDECIGWKTTEKMLYAIAEKA